MKRTYQKLFKSYSMGHLPMILLAWVISTELYESKVAGPVKKVESRGQTFPNFEKCEKEIQAIMVRQESAGKAKRLEKNKMEWTPPVTGVKITSWSCQEVKVK